MPEAGVGRRVRFIRDFDFKPVPSVTLAFRAGQLAFVTLDCAAAAVAKGRAVPADMPGPPAGIAATLARRRKAAGRG